MIWFIGILAAFLVLPGAAHATGIEVAIANFFLAVGVPSAAAATALATATLKLVVGTALSLVGQLFAEKPKGIKPQGIQTEQTTTGDTTPQKFVVGRYAVETHANTPAYSRNGVNNDDPNRILNYMLMEVSNKPVKGLTGRVVIDGEWQTLVEGANDPSRFDFQEIGFDKNGNPYGSMWFFDGTQTVAFFGNTSFGYDTHPDRPLTADHILKGSAYCNFEFAFNREIYTGLPAVRVELDGISLYDPRKDTTVGGSGSHRWDDESTWEFTQNPQVINYNILRGISLPTGDIWGGEVPAEDLPLDNWFAAMNECDVDIGGRPQYQAGFEINTGEMEPKEVINEMNRASFAQMSEFGGVFRVRVGGPAAPVMSLTDDDFLITEPSSYDPFPGLANTFNAVTGTYVEPADIWQARSVPAIINSDWEEEDGDRRLTLNIDLPAVARRAQAEQLMTAYIKDQRRFRTHRMVLPPSFALLEPLDTIEWTSAVNGYTAKVFEVMEVEHRANTLNQAVLVRERDAGDVDWSAGQDVVVADPSPFLDLTPPNTLIPNITVEAVPLEDSDGTQRRPDILLSWVVTLPEVIQELRWETRLIGDVTGPVQSSVADQSEGQTRISNLLKDEIYEVRAKFITDLPNDWSNWESVTTDNIGLLDKDFEDGIRSLFENQGLYPIQDVSSLPASGILNRKVFNRADGKLYEWDGSAWVLVVASAETDDLIGQITETQITDDAISTPKLQAGAVEATKIAGSTITGDKIVANTITGGLMAASGIITNTAQITDALITNVKIANAAVDTLRIAGNAATVASFSQSGSTLTGVDGNWRNAWAASTVYAVDDCISSNFGTFKCITAHTSTSTAPDPIVASTYNTNWVRAEQLALIGTVSIPADQTADIFLAANFTQGYSSGPQKWGFRIEVFSQNTSAITSFGRQHMSFGNDYPVATYIETFTNTRTNFLGNPIANNFTVNVYWTGEDSSLNLGENSSLSLVARYR